MLSRLIVFALLLPLLVPAGYAQVNTEVYKSALCEQGFHGALDLAINLKSGNSNYINVAPGMRLNYSGSGFCTFFIANYEFKQGAENKKIVNKGFGHLRHIHKLNHFLDLELFVQKEFDNFKLLRDRTLGGAGVRFTIAYQEPVDDEVEGFHLYVGLGAMMEHEEHDIAPLDEVTNLLRSTNYLNFQWLLSDDVFLSWITYIQPVFNDLDDYRLLSEAAILFDVTEHFAFRIIGSYYFDNDPVPGIENYDLEIKNGISISF